MSLRLEVNDHTDVPLSQAHDFAVKAECAGIDGVGIHDHQGSGHDVYLRLAEIANQTTRLTLFPSVTNPITRHPAVLAAIANSLAELHPGRIRITMGSGDQATSGVGLKAATVATMRESAMAIRALLHGESAMIDGVRIRKLDHVSNVPPPLFINASSPRMLKTAGEAADGVYAMVGVHPAVVKRAQEQCHRQFFHGINEHQNGGCQDAAADQRHVDFYKCLRWTVAQGAGGTVHIVRHLGEAGFNRAK